MPTAKFLNAEGVEQELFFPTGDGTALSPYTGHGADILAQLEAINAAASAIQAAAELLDNIVSGTEAQVDVVSVAIPSAIYHGQTTVTTAGTEVALASSQAILSGVTIKALAANTGIIYVGANPVTSSTGFALAAGEQIFIEVANLATIYLDSSVNGEGVSYVAS